MRGICLSEVCYEGLGILAIAYSESFETVQIQPRIQLPGRCRENQVAQVKTSQLLELRLSRP